MSSPAYASGERVVQHLDMEHHDTIPDYRIQPNGVDVGIQVVERINGSAHFRGPSEGYGKPSRTKVKLRKWPDRGASRWWKLPRGSYALTYDVEFEIPDNYVGRMYPRSRLMRSGLHLTSALWDQGYGGQGEGLLQIPQGISPVYIEEDALLAQFTLVKAEHADDYDGVHQGERLEEVDE